MIRLKSMLLLSALLLVGVTSAEEFSIGPPHPDSYFIKEDQGYIPPGFDDTRLEEPYDLDIKSLPLAIDWRSYAPVAHDQGACGTCWIFGSLGDMEMQMRILGMGIYDFSEDHLKECNDYNTRCAGAGNYWMSSNYLEKSGARLESCQPYHPYNYTCLTSCVPVKRVKELRMIANTEAAIKSALVNGPVITSMNVDAWGGAPSGAFYTYNGSYVLTGGGGATNHCVLIVGYDDPSFPAGHWIVRNSWGTSWGDDGYFYIAYGAGSIGTSAAQFISFEDPLVDQDMQLVFSDRHGCSASYGSSANTMWGAVRLVAPMSGYLERIEIVYLGSNFNYTIRIYDTKIGTSPSIQFTNLLKTIAANNIPQGGHFSIPVNPPLWMNNGNDFYVTTQFSVPSGGYPVPVDNVGFAEGQSFLSTTGSTWQSVSGIDINIRAVMRNPYPEAPALTTVGIGFLLAGFTFALLRRNRRRNKQL